MDSRQPNCRNQPEAPTGRCMTCNDQDEIWPTDCWRCGRMNLGICQESISEDQCGSRYSDQHGGTYIQWTNWGCPGTKSEAEDSMWRRQLLNAIRAMANFWKVVRQGWSFVRGILSRRSDVIWQVWELTLQQVCRDPWFQIWILDTQSNGRHELWEMQWQWTCMVKTVQALQLTADNKHMSQICTRLGRSVRWDVREDEEAHLEEANRIHFRQTDV